MPPPQVLLQEENELQVPQPPLIGHSCVLQLNVSDADPEHWAPPYAGAGLLDCLVRVWVPPPQVLLQEEKELQDPQPPSLGHCCVLQFNVSDAAPEHSAPPLAGVGLSHTLVRVWVPPPQVLLQEEKELQDPQPPLIANPEE